MSSNAIRKTAVATVAALAVAIGGTAYAASGSGSTGSTGFLAAVASKLGITTDKLKDATKAAALEQVDAQLAAGTITQAQADAMKTRIAASDGGFFGPGLGGPRGGHGGAGHLADAATYLGLTTDALVAKLQAGSTLANVAKAEGKTVAGLKAALLASEKKELADAVAAGRLTQAQADDILAGASERFDAMIAGTAPQGGRGHFGPPPAGTTAGSGSTTGTSL